MAGKRFAAYSVLGLTIFLTGCFGTQLTADNDGSTVTLGVGDPLTVTLESNPTTGYAWEITELDETLLENTGQGYFATVVTGDVVGAGGVEIWNFTAQAEGTTPLRLEYRRSFEPDEDPADTFEVTVVVEADQ